MPPPTFVMPGLDPGIHDFRVSKTVRGAEASTETKQISAGRGGRDREARRCNAAGGGSRQCQTFVRLADNAAPLGYVSFKRILDLEFFRPTLLTALFKYEACVGKSTRKGKGKGKGTGTGAVRQGSGRRGCRGRWMTDASSSHSRLAGCASLFRFTGCRCRRKSFGILGLLLATPAKFV
jgi:hypothetical protein